MFDLGICQDVYTYCSWSLVGVSVKQPERRQYIQRPVRTRLVYHRLAGVVYLPKSQFVYT